MTNRKQKTISVEAISSNLPFWRQQGLIIEKSTPQQNKKGCPENQNSLFYFY